MTGDVGDAARLRVFISYSREDLEFADQLFACLETTGFEPAIDRHGIAGGEDFRSRLASLIREADTVVFVLSPASASSAMCAWEVEESSRLGKRIIPVVCQPLAGTNPPPRLKDLDYIFFYPELASPGSGFGTGLARLVVALNTDHAWLREHTRLLTRAMEWEAAGRAENRLLSGSDIADAKGWAGRRPKGAPEPTALHLDYIRESEVAHEARLSAEHQKLQKMQALQAERELALESAEKANEERERTLDELRNALETTARVYRRQFQMLSLLAVLATSISFYYASIGDESEGSTVFVRTLFALSVCALVASFVASSERIVAGGAAFWLRVVGAAVVSALIFVAVTVTNNIVANKTSVAASDAYTPLVQALFPFVVTASLLLLANMASPSRSAFGARVVDGLLLALPVWVAQDIAAVLHIWLQTRTGILLSARMADGLDWSTLLLRPMPSHWIAFFMGALVIADLRRAFNAERESQRAGKREPA